MNLLSITYQTFAEKQKKIPARKAWYIDVINLHSVHHDNYGQFAGQSSKVYALIIDKQTKELMKLPIDGNQYVIKFCLTDFDAIGL